MGAFLADNSTYNITTENEISIILSHFSFDYIFDVIDDSIKNRFTFFQVNTPNIVQSMDNYYKQLYLTYTSEGQVIKEDAEEKYKQIIGLLCNRFNLQFNEDIMQDYFSPAYYLYSFLISDFSKNIITFFTNYIIKEKNAIYEMLNLNNFKKNKDTSTLYNKKTFKNMKLAIINANLDYVIRNLCAFDIDFETLLNCIYTDRNRVKYIQSIIVPVNDFFKEQFVPILLTPFYSTIITEIRLQIQKLCISDDITIKNI